MDNNKQVIVVECIVNAPLAHVWDVWTSPAHITQWNSASPDWHTTRAENDLRAGGRFLARMEAKDGSFGFDFSGTYTDVRTNQFIAYTLDDDRKVTITFTTEGDATRVVEAFEAESENSIALQKGGWQAIMDNFKKHAETI
ncbi:MAG: SRPBCC family protein [Taibaiella sp.]|nr:SRPBCC family protein [Taibaiella sp.]